MKRFVLICLLAVASVAVADAATRPILALESLEQQTLDRIFARLYEIWHIPVAALAQDYADGVLSIAPTGEPLTYSCLHEDGGAVIISLEESF